MLKRFTQYWWAPIGLVVLTPLYYLLPWARWPTASLAVGVPFLLLYTVVLPGWVLCGWLAPRRTDFLDRAAAASIFGFSFLFGVTLICVATGASLRLFAKLYPVVVGVVTIAGFVVGRPTGAIVEIPWKSGDRTPILLFGAFLLIVFVFVMRAGMPIHFFKDSLDHVAYVSETAQLQEAFPTTAFYLDPGSNGEDIRKGFLHVFYGYGVAYLGVGTLPFLNVINAILTVVLLLVVYSSSLLLFRDRRVAILSAVIFVIAVDGGLRSSLIRQSFYPHRFAVVFFFYVVVHGLRYLRHPRRRELILAAIFAFAACAAHVLFAVLIAFAGLSILVWTFCFPGNTMKAHVIRVLKIGGAVAAGMLPVCLFRYVTDFPEPNDLHAEVQGVVFITRNLFIADPIQVWQWFGPIGLVSILTIVPLWRRREQYAALGYVFASLLTLVAVLFNPLLLPPLRNAITYLIARLNHMCFFYFITAYFVVAYLSSADARKGFGRFGRLVAVLMAISLLAGVWDAVDHSSLSARHLRKERLNSYLLWDDELKIIASDLPPHSVIASDPMTSYSITAFTTDYTLCTFDQHAPPNDLRLAERIQDARAILSPEVSMQRTVELLGKHRVTHVVLNNRFPPELNLDYWAMDRSIFPWTREKFAAHPELFRTLHEAEDFVILAWNGERSTADTVHARPSVLDTLPPGFTAVGEAAGAAILEGFALERDIVARGDEMGARFVWSGEGHYDLANWVVAVRFDHTDPGLPFGGRVAPKVVRKIKENLRGGRYRFREQHKIRSGFLSPDTWEPGDLVIDGTTIRVPTDLVTGDYRVSVKLLKIEHQPTYRFLDLFSDNDIYQGIAITRVTIE